VLNALRGAEGGAGGVYGRSGNALGSGPSRRYVVG
jgi:flagella synthesis protein FlgN